MTDDLVERLRSIDDDQICTGCYTIVEAADEAADHIENLEAALREMLAKCTWEKRKQWCGSIDCHCRIARKALDAE
jgi:hypothetical protein